MISFFFFCPPPFIPPPSLKTVINFAAHAGAEKMNLLGPDHRTSHAAFQSLARLAAGRVWRLNKDIFLLIRPSVACPPRRRRCTCSSQRLMYVLSSSSIHSVSQLSLTIFLLPLMTWLDMAFDYRLWLRRRRHQIHRNFVSHLSLAVTCTCAPSQRLHRQSSCAPAAVHTGSLASMISVYAPGLAQLVSQALLIVAACS